MNDVRPQIYAGHDAVIVRMPIGRRLVRAIVSREVLEVHFQAGHTQQDWIDAYEAHAGDIAAVVQGKLARACPEPILVSKYDFASSPFEQGQSQQPHRGAVNRAA